MLSVIAWWDHTKIRNYWFRRRFHLLFKNTKCLEKLTRTWVLKFKKSKSLGDDNSTSFKVSLLLFLSSRWNVIFASEVVFSLSGSRFLSCSGKSHFYFVYQHLTLSSTFRQPPWGQAAMASLSATANTILSTLGRNITNVKSLVLQESLDVGQQNFVVSRPQWNCTMHGIVFLIFTDRTKSISIFS